MKKFIYLTITAILLLSKLPAQDLSVGSDFVLLEGNTNDGVLHWYTTLTNNTTDTINYTWYMYKDDNWPSQWTTYLTDPIQNHNPVDGKDSFDFFMDTIWDPLDKLILQVQHNGFATTSGVMFVLKNKLNPLDSQFVYFRVAVNQPSSIENSLNLEQKIVILDKSRILIQSVEYDLISISDISGKKLSYNFDNNVVQLIDFKENMVFVTLKNRFKSQTYTQKIVLK